MQSQFTKSEIIRAGIEEGASYKKIGDVLQSQGYSRDYNPLTQLANYQNLPSNVAKNAVNLGRDLRTFSGILMQPVIQASQDAYKAPVGLKKEAWKESFKKALDNDATRKTYKGLAAGAAIGSLIPKVGPVGGAALGSSLAIAGPKGLLNAILSTYDTSLEDIKSGNTKWQDVAQGAFRNPLYAAFDTAPITGRVAVKSANKITTKLPESLQQILQPQNLRDFNRDITQSLGASKARLSDVYKGYSTLESLPLVNREKIYRNIVMNEGGLDKTTQALADSIKKDLRSAEADIVKKGFLSKSLTRNNTIAQYVMNKIKDDRILHNDIVNMLSDVSEPWREEFTRISVTEPETMKNIFKLVDEGSKLYDEGKIAYFTQALAPVTDPLGNVVASDIAKTGSGYFGTRRIIGKSTPEMVGKVFDSSLKYQLDQVGKIINIDDVVADIAKKYGIDKINYKGKNISDYKIPKGKTPFSEKAFRKYITDAFESGKEIDVSGALRHGRVAEEGAVLIDNIYLKALNNAFKTPAKTPGRRLLGAFKKAVLAQPHWIVLNRIGNLTNNFMEGVTLSDYLDAINVRSVRPPKQLKQQTSFNSYINEGIEGIANQTAKSAFTEPINRILRAGDRWSVSDKSLSDVWKTGAEFVAGSSDLTANPFFKAEAALELQDRYANFIRQAKREANKTGKDWKDIVKEADTNSELFNKLNNEVNKSLGDYVGRNYALPSGYYDFLSESVPFYRFLTQTGRTTGRQIVNNPIGFASNVSIPSRVGNIISEDILNKYNLDRDRYKGGVPYTTKTTGNVRTIGLEPLPVGAVSEDIGNILAGNSLSTMLSPYLTTVPDIINFQRFGRTATTPRLTELMLTAPSEAKDFKPTLSERLGYGGNQLLSTIYSPYILGTRYIPPLLASALGKGIQTPYDTNAFVQNPLTYKRILPEELIGRWFGIQTGSNYPGKSKSKKSKQKDVRAAKQAQQKVIQLQQD